MKLDVFRKPKFVRHLPDTFSLPFGRGSNESSRWCRRCGHTQSPTTNSQVTMVVIAVVFGVLLSLKQTGPKLGKEVITVAKENVHRISPGRTCHAM